jgi:periplasmic copper chaperone A
MQGKIELLERLTRAGAALMVGLGAWSGAQAQVTVDRAWARTTVPNQVSSGAFMRITAHNDVRLTRVRSPVAGIVEVHEMTMDKGIMRMRPAGELPIKAGQTIELKSKPARSCC